MAGGVFIVMLKYISAKRLIIWIGLFTTLYSAAVFSQNQQTLRLLVWEGYAPEAQREQFRQYIQKKYAIQLTLEVNYIIDAADGFEALRLKKSRYCQPCAQSYQ